MSEKHTVKMFNEVKDVSDSNKSFKIEVISETEDKNESVTKAYEMMRMAKHKIRSLQTESFR